MDAAPGDRPGEGGRPALAGLSLAALGFLPPILAAAAHSLPD
jgi:hypothetical protein